MSVVWKLAKKSTISILIILGTHVKTGVIRSLANNIKIFFGTRFPPDKNIFKSSFLLDFTSEMWCNIGVIGETNELC